MGFVNVRVVGVCMLPRSGLVRGAIMPKDCTPIPADVANAVLFAHEHTCCVCNERGRPVQIHHIDDDPTNHSPANLAVLCLLDHDQTQVRGGFGRTLQPGAIIRYRDDWLERVSKRRVESDRIASERRGGAELVSAREERTRPPEIIFDSYIEHLPELRRAIYAQARHEWDTGSTMSMRIATRDVIDVLEKVLINLASWFPEQHFGETSADEYFSKFIAARYQWRLALNAPEGPGTAGTIAPLLAAGDVLGRCRCGCGHCRDAKGRRGSPSVASTLGGCQGRTKENLWTRLREAIASS
jgi:hypothetical protein